MRGCAHASGARPPVRRRRDTEMNGRVVRAKARLAARPAAHLARLRRSGAVWPSATSRQRRDRAPVRLRTIQTLVADHPLVAHKLTKLPDINTQTPVFRSLTDKIVTLLAFQAPKDIQVEALTLRPPLGQG